MLFSPGVTPRTTDVAALSTGLLAVSFSAILIRLCSSTPTGIAFWRLALAGGVFLIWNAIRYRAPGPEPGDRLAVFLAALFLAAHFYFWIAALFMTSINSSVVLLAIQPLFALVLQTILHRTPITRRNALSLAMGLAGAAILAGGDFLRGGSLAGRGDVYAIVSAAFSACYLFVGSYRKGRLTSYLGSVYGTAGVLMAAIALVAHDSLAPAREIDWLWFALLAIVPTLVGHTMLNRSMRKFPAYVVNLSVLVEPLLTSVWAFLLFAETLTRNVVLGGVFILAAVVTEVMPREVVPSE